MTAKLLRHCLFQTILFILYLNLSHQNTCTDFYVYKPYLDKYYMFQDSQSDYQKNQRTKNTEEFPQKEGVLIIPFLSKSQILKLRQVNLNTDNVEEEFYDAGTQGYTDYDYVLPLCFNNQTFLMKVDLVTSLIYVASMDLEENSLRRYQPTLSLTHELLYEHNSRCLQSISETKQNPYQIPNTRVNTQSTKCNFIHYDSLQNYTFSGEYLLEQIDLSFNQNGQPQNALSNIGKSNKNEEKYIIGIIRSQNKPFVTKNTNGFLGLGSQIMDNSYSESFLNRMTERYNLNGKVFSICLNHAPESGGILMLGGYDKSMLSIDQTINWISFSKVNQYLSHASSVNFGEQIIEKKVDVIYDTKTPFIHLSQTMLNQIIEVFIQQHCEGNKDIIKDLPTLCENNEYHIFRKSQRGFNPRGKQNHLCSIFRIFDTQDGEEGIDQNTIILGSQVLRNYIVIVDNQLSRIGFAQKQGVFCNPDKSETIISINDSNHVRLGVNCAFFIMILVIAGKSTTGCIQFFDFGSSSGPAPQSSNQQNQQNAQNQDQSHYSQNQFENLDDQNPQPIHIPHQNFQDELSQYEDEASYSQSFQQQPQVINHSRSNSGVHQRNIVNRIGNSAAAPVGERHITHTFRSDERSEFS
eukprot:403333133